MLPAKITSAIESAAENTTGPCALKAALRTFAALYGAGMSIRNAAYDALPFLSHGVKRPVISIGGIRAGGTGKTPVAAMVGEHLIAAGRTVVFLSRGYGRGMPHVG